MQTADAGVPDRDARFDRAVNDPSSLRGLTEAQVQERLASEGFNELPEPNRRTPFRIVGEVLREPMLALLLGGGIVVSRAGQSE